MLLFQSDPLNHSLCVTGHPVVELKVASDASDMQLFVYLEERLANGKVRYITEGLVRGIHKTISGNQRINFPMATPSFEKSDHFNWQPHTFEKVMVDLIPISYTLQPGSRIQISITGKDVDHFDEPDHQASLSKEIKVKLDRDGLARLVLPVMV
jgi:putative CocE/NonD family hydrolase